MIGVVEHGSYLCAQNLGYHAMTRKKGSALYTIGHSNHKIEDFIDLLKMHEISCIVDVRSAPYSRYCPQFNLDMLTLDLRAADIEYMYLGDKLGARPASADCRD